jgi:hypothetical protein
MQVSRICYDRKHAIFVKVVSVDDRETIAIRAIYGRVSCTSNERAQLRACVLL